MGSSSSKSAGQNTAVANVNNDDITGFPQRNVRDGQKFDDQGQGEINTLNNNDYHKDFGRQSPLKPIEPNRKEKERDKKEKEKELKKITKLDRDRNGSAKVDNQSKLNAFDLQYADDSDFNDDIDEVLKIPLALAANFSKEKKKDKDRRNKNDIPQNNNENEDISYNRRNDLSYGISRNEDQSLPETYAQRLQRKQYKLQQEMLIREKTIMRVSQEWDVKDEEEMEIDEPVRGFDPSKFRAANKGQDGKKELFQTADDQDEFRTPRYLQTTGQEIDDVDVGRTRNSPELVRLPSYNQSELDLMAELENDIL